MAPDTDKMAAEIARVLTGMAGGDLDAAERVIRRTPYLGQSRGPVRNGMNEDREIPRFGADDPDAG